ncbi:hypothetical protein ACFFRR_008889 [Megaselia abdita]
MFTYIENYEDTWLQCNQYNSLVKTEACNILNRVHDFIFQSPIDTGSIFDNWLLKLTLMLFLGFIISSLYTVFTEEPKSLKEIRSRIDNSWKALLNLICAIRMTQELQKRNEILKIEQIKNYMLTQFPEKEPAPPVREMFKEVEQFEIPINLETISSENTSMKSLKSDQSTGSLITSAFSSQPLNDIPMSAEFPVHPKFVPPSTVVEVRNCKVQFDLSKKPVLRGSEVLEANKKKTQKPPPNKMIISNEDLVKLPLPEKRRVFSPNPLTRSSSAVEETPTNKGGIFEQRKKMFERSEGLISAQKSRVQRSSPRLSNTNEMPDHDSIAK